MRSEFKWLFQPDPYIKATLKLLSGSVLKRTVSWPVTHQTLSGLMSPRPSSKVSQSFHHHTLGVRVGQPSTNNPSPLIKECQPGTWDCFYVPLQYQNRHPNREPGEEFNCGKWKDDGIGKEVGVPEPRAACSELAPVNACRASPKTYPSELDPICNLRRMEPLADFEVRLPWDSRH